MHWLHGQAFQGVRPPHELLHGWQSENSQVLLVKVLWGPPAPGQGSVTIVEKQMRTKVFSAGCRR